MNKKNLLNDYAFIFYMLTISTQEILELSKEIKELSTELLFQEAELKEIGLPTDWLHIIANSSGDVVNEAIDDFLFDISGLKAGD